MIFVSKDVDCGKTGLIFKMMETSQNEVKNSYHSNMSTILKLSLKFLMAFMLTDDVYFVEIG